MSFKDVGFDVAKKKGFQWGFSRVCFVSQWASRDLFWEKRMAEDEMEVEMEVDEPQQATKLTAAVKGKGKMCSISQQQLTGGPW